MKTDFCKSTKKLIKEILTHKESNKVRFKPLKLKKCSNCSSKIDKEKRVILDTLIDKKKICLFSKNYEYMNERFFDRIPYEKLDPDCFSDILVLDDDSFHTLGSRVFFCNTIKNIAIKIMKSFNEKIIIHIPIELAPMILESNGYYLVIAPLCSYKERVEND